MLPIYGMLMPAESNYFDYLKQKNNFYFDKDTGLKIKQEFTSTMYEITENNESKEYYIKDVSDIYYEFETVKYSD